MSFDSPPHLPTDAELERLMAVFYARVRADKTIGPIFEEAIGMDGAAWIAHERKIAGFWRNALGLDRGGYAGSPMAAHAARPRIEPAHFAIWLDIFEDAARDCLSRPAAEHIVALARRIGDSLEKGLRMMRDREGVPNLR